MFRLTRLKPPSGWVAVAWELAVVTLGVLLALAVQQWAEGRSIQAKLDATTQALREELAEHYTYAVEFRTVYPCVKAQVSRLRDHVLSPDPVMERVPLYFEQQFRFVMRQPSKVHPTDAWEAAVSDGLIQRFEPSFRQQLAGHYAQIPQIQEFIAANDATEAGLIALTHRWPLDVTDRYGIVKEIEQLISRLETLDLNYGQQIENIQKVGMLPHPGEAQAVTERYGTYQFCKAHGLPMRPYSESMEAVPN